jgi:hypothetical protein
MATPKATTAKTTASKTTSPAKKPVTTKAATTKKPVAAKKPAATKKAAPKSGKIGPEERYRMVEVAAYFLAERNGFTGSPVDYWTAAEIQITKLLSK